MCEDIYIYIYTHVRIYVYVHLHGNLDQYRYIYIYIYICIYIHMCICILYACFHLLPIRAYVNIYIDICHICRSIYDMGIYVYIESREREGERQAPRVSPSARRPWTLIQNLPHWRKRQPSRPARGLPLRFIGKLVRPVVGSSGRLS